MEWGAIVKEALLVVISAAFGFMVSAARKVSPKQLAEFEERVVDPICERLEKIEFKVENFVTRSELKDNLNRVERAIEVNRTESRQSFQTIFLKLEERHTRHRGTD